jgi:nucleoside-diphosphate-sugar epimerase
LKILLTGASSFTGYWFARLLAEAGHEVTAPLRRNPTSYDELRKRRLASLPQTVKVLADCPLGSDGFMSLVEGGRWDVLCHHGAQVDNYRSPEYDVFAAIEANTANLRNVLSAMAGKGTRGVVVSGTVFETNEGVGEEPLRAFSPYGLAKACTSLIVEYWAGLFGLTFGKFVIANPFGPLEEPRFCKYLFDCWRSGKVAEVKTPAYLRDNVPVRLLAGAYVRFVEQVACRGPGRQHVGPSFYAESQGSFAARVARETSSRTGWDCRLSLANQTEFVEPRTRLNKNPVVATAIEERSFWDEYVAFAAGSTG